MPRPDLVAAGAGFLFNPWSMNADEEFFSGEREGLMRIRQLWRTSTRFLSSPWKKRVPIRTANYGIHAGG